MNEAPWSLIDALGSPGGHAQDESVSVRTVIEMSERQPNRGDLLVYGVAGNDGLQLFPALAIASNPDGRENTWDLMLYTPQQPEGVKAPGIGYSEKPAPHHWSYPSPDTSWSYSPDLVSA
jgi:hypothetical protein